MSPDPSSNPSWASSRDWVAAACVLAALLSEAVVAHVAVPPVEITFKELGFKELPSPTLLILAYARFFVSYGFIVVPLHLLAAIPLWWFGLRRWRPWLDCSLIGALTVGGCFTLLGLVMPFVQIGMELRG